MNSFLETVANSCIPELLQPAVILELKKPGNYRHQVQSLSRQCIREIIRRKIKPKSIGFIRFKLFFQEELNILETSQLTRDDEIFENLFGFTRLLSGFNRFLNQKLKIQLKNDSHIMRQVLEQNLDRETHDFVTIVILEKSFRVVLGEDIIVEVAHDNYSTELAMVFTRICFEKNIRMIQLEMEIKHNEQRVEQMLSSFINRIGLVAPDDQSWESACRDKGNFIYYHNSNFCTSTSRIGPPKEHYSFMIQLFIIRSIPEQLNYLRRIYHLSNEQLVQ